MRLRLWLLLTALLLAGVACRPDLSGAVDRDELLAVVGRDLVRFDEGAPPVSMLERLASQRVIVVGEYHGISHHDAFVGDLAVALQPSGLTTVLLEFPQAYSWLIDGYVRGVADTPGEGAARAYGPLLDRIRDANADRPAERRIAVRAIDVNPTIDDFLAPFRGLAQQLGQPAVMADLAAALEGRGDAVADLAAARAELAARDDVYRAAWGDPAYATVLDAIDGEARSVAVRGFRAGPRRDRAREEAMLALVDRQLAAAPGRVLINVGYVHAQKRHQTGSVDVWLGERLDQSSPYAAGDTYVVVVVPASGEARIGGRVHTFDVGEDSPPNELFRVMQELAGDRLAFLPLDDEVFVAEEVIVNYLPDLALGPPREVFDAFVLLPEVHVTEP